MTQASNPPNPALRANIHTALTLWHQTGVPHTPLEHLQLFQAMRRANGQTAQQTVNLLLLQALEALEATHEQEAVLLRRRFLDNELAHRIANELNLAESTLYRKQNEAIDHLTAIIQTQEAQAQAAHQTRLLHRLEARSYGKLIGVREHQAKLAASLAQPEPPWIILIEGMGGLGKTALADALVRDLVTTPHFADVGWVTARQQVFNLGGSLTAMATPALSVAVLIDALLAQLIPELPRSASAAPEQARQLLASRLKTEPHLIVIDNLETVIDVETLLPTLRDLANPTKFVLTSRDNLYGETGLYHFPLPELSMAHALQLVRHEAQQSNLPQVMQASDADLMPIWQKVGGNPLALRLIVGQLHVHGLDLVLGDLMDARGAKTENFYTYLYRSAWDNLDELARQTLLALPMVTDEGGTFAYLMAVSGLLPRDLRTALDQLVRLNLVDSRGGLQERHYSIHNLTRTFLHEQVAKWRG